MRDAAAVGKGGTGAYISVMTDEEFDAALVAAAFSLGADEGWQKVSAAAAAQRAGLDLALARGRFPRPGMILSKFGEMADEQALAGAMTDGAARDRLFDILLRRLDFLQKHRAGVLALLKAAPLMPPLAMWLAKATDDSMSWMLEGAGISATGLRGAMRKKGLLAVWTWGVRAWAKDDSEDLAATMAAVDKALERAAQVAAWLGDPKPMAEAPSAEPELPFTAEESAPPAML